MSCPVPAQELPRFRPAWWLKGAHLQTIWGGVMRPRLKVDLRRERFELKDGDFLDLDWLAGPANAPLVILLHGLAGSSESPYIRSALLGLKERDQRAVVLNFRGCGGEPNRLPRGYHSGETGDLSEFLEHLKITEPNTVLGAMGFSLGGNVLLKHLGEQGDATPIRAAVGVSVPYVLAASSERLSRGTSRLYLGWLLRKIRRDVRAKKRTLAGAGIDVNRVLNARSLRELDEHLTAPLHGFQGPDDYYTRCSSRQFVAGIQRPTLLIHALDDPFLSPSVVPQPAECGALVEQVTCQAGGHVGFIEGALPGVANSWLDGPPLDWLRSQFD